MSETRSITTATSSKRAQRLSDQQGRPGGSRGMRVLVTGILVVVAVYFLVPVYWVVIAATKSTEDLFGSNGFLLGSEFSLWSNLHEVLTYDGGIFVRWFGNSVLYAGVGALIATYLAAAGGYALAKYRFRGRNLVFGTILGGVLVPGTATALPLFLLFSQLGLANTYWSVLLPSLVSPFGLFLCRIYADATIDDSLIEAARIDGASDARILWQIVMPISKAVTAVIALFYGVGYWNAFFNAVLYIRDTEKWPLQMVLRAYVLQGQPIPGSGGTSVAKGLGW